MTRLAAGWELDVTDLLGAFGTVEDCCQVQALSEVSVTVRVLGRTLHLRDTLDATIWAAMVNAAAFRARTCEDMPASAAPR